MRWTLSWYEKCMLTNWLDAELNNERKKWHCMWRSYQIELQLLFSTWHFPKFNNKWSQSIQKIWAQYIPWTLLVICGSSYKVFYACFHASKKITCMNKYIEHTLQWCSANMSHVINIWSIITSFKTLQGCCKLLIKHL